MPGLRLGFGRYHFLLRRLHSLTGVLIVGGFLLEHMLTNFGAVVGGAEKYNHDVGLIASIPWLPVVEWGFIFVPLAFHGLYGLLITVTGQSNVLAYPYGGNVRYVLQRVTALIVTIFVVVHLLKYRFHYLLGGPHFEAADAYAMTAAGLVNPAIVWFYVIGITAAAFHFANGIWTGLITWGVTIGPQSQRRTGWICAAIGVALGVMGLASLFWFHWNKGI